MCSYLYRTRIKAGFYNFCYQMNGIKRIALVLTPVLMVFLVLSAGYGGGEFDDTSKRGSRTQRGWFQSWDQGFYFLIMARTGDKL